MITTNWVLQSALPTAYQHRAEIRPSGTTRTTALCGVKAMKNRFGRARWFDIKSERLVGRKACSNCEAAA